MSGIISSKKSLLKKVFTQPEKITKEIDVVKKEGLRQCTINCVNL